MSGDFSAAKKLIERAMDIRGRELPVGQEYIRLVMNGLGNLNLCLGKYTEALRYPLTCKKTVNSEIEADVRMN